MKNPLAAVFRCEGGKGRYRDIGNNPYIRVLQKVLGKMELKDRFILVQKFFKATHNFHRMHFSRTSCNREK